ncbi:hypothetical protein J1605_009833 [Eschrichtius robustus]|uniref:Secreted protein n=1 Tax=Eschrichtius robustus TaxID=9764 RepID=A0AB34GXM0_ESCRO|nr:hypothetical protein J1605_009833 [Eschrichtius robustus]
MSLETVAFAAGSTSSGCVLLTSYHILTKHSVSRWWFPIQPPRASLVAQRLRICPPMQGTRVRALVWEDPTCHGATGPVSHNY